MIAIKHAQAADSLIDGGCLELAIFFEVDQKIEDLAVADASEIGPSIMNRESPQNTCFRRERRQFTRFRRSGS